MPIQEYKLTKVQDKYFDINEVTFSKPEFEEKMINGKKVKKLNAKILYNGSDKSPIFILNNVYSKRGMQDYQDDKKFNMKFKISETISENFFNDLQEKFYDYLQKHSKLIFKKDYSKQEQRGIITGMLDSYTILKKNSDDEGNLYLKAKLPSDYTIKTPDFFLLQESEKNKSEINQIEVFELGDVFKLDGNGRPSYNSETKRREFSKEWNSYDDDMKQDYADKAWMKIKSILRYDSSYTIAIIPEIYFLPAGGSGISFKINVIQAPYHEVNKKQSNNSIFTLNENTSVKSIRYDDLNNASTENTSNTKNSEEASDEEVLTEEEEEESEDELEA
jgi:hypothetical protein